MKAGPELDALMATKAMGWKPWEEMLIEGEPPLWWLPPDCIRPTLFKPSTRIEDSWRLIEKLREKFICDDSIIELRYCVDYGHKENPWYVVIWGTFAWSHGGEIVTGDARAATAPEAICLAALQVVK